MKNEKKGTKVLVIGGARSGKSRYALNRGEKITGRKAFIATGEPLDPEMKGRIEMHKKERSEEWTTIEEPVRLVDTLQDISGCFDVVIVDCLTLWLSNMFSGRHGFSNINQEWLHVSPSHGDDDSASNESIGHEQILSQFLITNRAGVDDIPSRKVLSYMLKEIIRLQATLSSLSYTTIFVSNEVGEGIVPANRMARIFRDMNGWMNQKIAKAVNEVYRMICGIPLRVK